MAQPDRILTSAAALEDAQLARRAVTLIHPGWNRYTAAEELDAAWDRLETHCERDITEREFFAQLSRVLGLYRCSHTKAEPSPGWAEWRTETASYLPFRFVVDDGRMIVIRSAADMLRAGDEIEALDGNPAGEMMAAMLAAVPADGRNMRVRRYALSSTSDLDDSEWDHFLPAFYRLNSPVRLEVRRGDESVSLTIRVPLMKYADRLAALAEPPVPRDLDESITLDLRSDNVAILRIGTFVAYRKPIKPEAIYRPWFEKIKQSGAECLILDLRGNSGGSDEAALDLLRFLVADPVRLAVRRRVKAYRFGDLTDRLKTWDRSDFERPDDAFRDLGNGFYELPDPEIEPLVPLEPSFRGRLIVLCGPANASGTTMFLARLRTLRKVTTVGEPTGGSIEGPTAGVIFFLPLPNSGIRVRIPAIRTVTEFKSRNGDGSLHPDVEICTTAEDLLTGRDPVLDKVLAIARDEGTLHKGAP